MARPLRLEFSGALYHVISRGIEGRDVFADRRDREKFLEYLRENLKRYDVVLYIYVLMDNHYHLLVETPAGNLSSFMHALNASYVVYHNRRLKRAGPLFQGRYKAILVDKEAYLLVLSRYLHLNPVRAHLVRTPEEYEWSSYRTYLGMRRENWIDCEWVRERLGANWRIAYQQFVQEKAAEQDPFQKVRASFVLGSESFVQKVKARISRARRDAEIPSAKKLTRPSMDDVLQKTSQFFRVSEEEILTRRRDFLPRKIALYLTRKCCSEKIEEMGKRFGINYPAVSKAVARFEETMGRQPETVRIVSMLKKDLLCL